MGTKVIKRIPRGARTSVATKLSQIINKCTESNTVAALQDLFLFPYRILSTTDYKKVKRSLTSKIKSNIKNNNSNVEASKVLHHSSSKSKYIESKVFDGDIRGAIRILSSDANLLNYDDSVFTELKGKHPPGVTSDFPCKPEEDHISLEVMPEDVLNAVFSFKSGSAGGIDALRPEHLKDLLSKPYWRIWK